MVRKALRSIRGQLMLKDLIENGMPLMQSELVNYGVCAVGLAAWVGIYYLGEYLFSDRDPDLDFSPD
jgi:hypothetical protein